jgi:hypothetical protein
MQRRLNNEEDTDRRGGEPTARIQFNIDAWACAVSGISSFHQMSWRAGWQDAPRGQEPRGQQTHGKGGRLHRFIQLSRAPRNADERRSHQSFTEGETSGAFPSKEAARARCKADVGLVPAPPHGFGLPEQRAATLPPSSRMTAVETLLPIHSPCIALYKSSFSRRALAMAT